LASLNTGDEYLGTDVVSLTHQNFAAEVYGPEDEEEDFNLASALIPDMVEQSRDLPYMLDLGRCLIYVDD
jgi:hypothetical protein